MRLCAVRGATTLSADDSEIYAEEVLRLIQTLVKDNDIETQNIVSVFFTVTQDLHSANPAMIVRQHLGWAQVPMLCSGELDVKGLLPRCVRVLIQFYSTGTQDQCRPVYLNEAQHLRPDLV